ncbi:MAG TPA: CvpA family protein [Candidatus Saccharimonadales bacterium]|nr:CvpA family protein [Candidatus Saccharimonadales bacterium]
MNGLDWLIAGILVLSAVHAAAQGFVFELFSLAGTVVGYLVAAWEYPVAARYLSPYVKNDLVASGAGFLLIFVSVVILAGIAGRIARWATKSVGLRWFDRFLGGVFGFLRGALVVMVLVMAMASFLPSSSELAKSSLAQYFLVAGRAAIYAGPGDLKHKFRDGLKSMDQIRGNSSEAAHASVDLV